MRCFQGVQALSIGILKRWCPVGISLLIELVCWLPRTWTRFTSTLTWIWPLRPPNREDMSVWYPEWRSVFKRIRTWGNKLFWNLSQDIHIILRVYVHHVRIPQYYSLLFPKSPRQLSSPLTPFLSISSKSNSLPISSNKWYLKVRGYRWTAMYFRSERYRVFCIDSDYGPLWSVV